MFDFDMCDIGFHGKTRVLKTLRKCSIAIGFDARKNDDTIAKETLRSDTKAIDDGVQTHLSEMTIHLI